MDSVLTEDSILLLIFLFSRSKASDAIIGIIYWPALIDFLSFFVTKLLP